MAVKGAQVRALLRANTQQKPLIYPELQELRQCDQCWCVDTSLAVAQSWLSKYPRKGSQSTADRTEAGLPCIQTEKGSVDPWSM